MALHIVRGKKSGGRTSNPPLKPKPTFVRLHGGKAGERHYLLQQPARAQTKIFRNTLEKVLQKWGITDHRRVALAWKNLYQQRVMRWHELQRMAGQLNVGLHHHALLLIRKRLEKEQSARVILLIGAAVKRINPEMSSHWKEPPAGLYLVLKSATKPVWQEFIDTLMLK